MYSKPDFLIKFISKHYKINYKQAYLHIKNNYKNFIKIYGEKGAKELIAFNEIEFKIINGDCTNIYIKDKELFETLLNSPVKIDIPIVDVLNLIPESIYKKKISFGNGVQRVILSIHHKMDNVNSFNYYIQETKAIDNENIPNQITILSSNDKDFQYTELVWGDKKYKDLDFENNSERKKYTDLILNLIFYVNAFPDKLLTGVPEDFISTTEYKSIKNIKIESHESLIDRSSVTPHFRKGHFAHLESDRYVNKKGQIIWRSASMVKGFQAKTVIE